MPSRSLEQVLAEWRDRERELRSSEQDEATTDQVRAEIDALRDEYQRMTSRHRATSDQLHARVREGVQQVHYSGGSADASPDIPTPNWQREGSAPD